MSAYSPSNITSSSSYRWATVWVTTLLAAAALIVGALANSAGATGDAIGPDIQSLTVTPASARPGDTVTISMAVTDETGVQNVSFYMEVGGTQNDICGQSTSRVSGDALSGTWEKVCAIPNPVLNGTYVVTPFAQDVLGRYTNMNGQNPIALTTQLTITDAPTTTTTTTTVPDSSTTTTTTVPQTTTTTVPASSTTTTTTTTVPDSSTTTTTTVPAPEVFVPQSQVAAPETTVAAPVTTIAAPVVPATTVVPATSTTVVSVTSSTVPVVRSVVSSSVPSTTVVSVVTSTTLAPVVVPDAPLAEPGAAGVVIDGEAVDAELSRSENRLVLTAGDVSATAFGETADGVRIPLDESGALRLESGDVIVVEGAGFEPGAEVEVWMMSTPTLLGDLVADRSGAVSGRFVPPVTLEPGEHRLVLSGEVPVVLAFGVFVVSEATALRLGFPLWIPVSIAIGLALIVPTRYIRRRRALTDGAH